MISVHKNKTYLTNLLIIVIAILTFASPVLAATILTDDVVFGEDSIIRDVSNGNDFLRLDFTTPYTYNEIIGEFGMGGNFEGWAVASFNELSLLGTSAGIVHGSTDPTTLATAEELRDWFGHVRLSTTHEYVRGLIAEITTGISGPAQEAFSIGRRFNVTPNEVDFRISGYGYGDDRSEDVFLVRAVPLPGAIWLLGSALIGFIGLRRKVRA